MRSGGRVTVCAASVRRSYLSGNRRSVTSRRPRKASSAAVVARSKCSVDPSRARSGMPSSPPTRNPTAKPETMRGKSSFIWRTSSNRPACPPMNTNPTWSAIGKATRSTADIHDAVRHEDHPRDGEESREAAERRRRDANEAGPARGTGDERRRAAADHRDRDVCRGQPLRAVRVQEDRVRRNDEERERHSERESLRGEECDDAARRRVAHRVRSAWSATAASRATSASMTPWASSGQSARSSSRTVLSRRSASVGSRAVTDAARGCETSAASSPTVVPEPSSTSVCSPRCTRTLPSTIANRCASTAPSSMRTSPRRPRAPRTSPRRRRRARDRERARTDRRDEARRLARRGRVSRWRGRPVRRSEARRSWSAWSVGVSWKLASRLSERTGSTQCLRKQLGADRLPDVVVHPGREARLALLEHGVCGHGDDAGSRLGRPTLADPPGCVEPVELGHLHVHQDDVVGADAREPPMSRARSPPRRRGSRAVREPAAPPSGSRSCPRPARSARTTSRACRPTRAQRPVAQASPRRARSPMRRAAARP